METVTDSAKRQCEYTILGAKVVLEGWMQEGVVHMHPSTFSSMVDELMPIAGLIPNAVRKSEQ